MTPSRRRVGRAACLALVVLTASARQAAAQEPPPGPVTGPPTTTTPTEPIPAGCLGGPPGPAYPGTQCPDGSIPVPAAGPPGCQFGPSTPPAPGTVCPDGSAPRDRIADRRLRNILGLDEANEPHPLEAYDIGCDEGSWSSFLRKLWCASEAMPFALGKWAIGIGTDLMGWALEFRLATSLAPVAGLLSRVYDTSLIGPLGVRQLAWTLAMFVAGWHLLRGRGARGASEIASTFLIACVGSIVLANPQGYLEGSIALAQNTSGAVLEAIDDTLQPGGSSQDADAVRDRLDSILRRSFVAEPYDLINWGESLTGECAAARDEILARGPWGSDDEPRDIMRDAGCGEQADFNHDPTDSRAAASLIVMLASIAATVLLVAIALVVFLAQLTLVALFGGASLCWALALFPGIGRELLWWWLSRLAWAVMATVGATFVLSWLAVTVTAALNATTDFSVIQRCLVALLIVAFAFRLRSQIGRQAEALSRRFGDRVAQSVGQPSRAPAVAAGAVAGFGLSAMARSWAFDTPGGQYAYNRLYARHFTRGYRSRGQRLGGVRRVLGRASSIDRGVTDTARAVGRGARTAVLAPVLAPQAVAATRARATAASRRARSRLDEARATRRQWTHNVAHPIEAVRAANRPAPPRTPTRPPTGRAAGRATRPEPDSPSAVRDRVQDARAAHRERAREAGHPMRQLLDAQREAAESRRPSDHPQAALEAQRQAVADARRAAMERPRVRPAADTDDPRDGM